jgi:hypothetical protein
MAIRVVVHINNEEAFIADLDALPDQNATYIYVKNPRTRDNKQVPWSTERLRAAMFPMARITYIEEVVTQADEREVERFYRDRTQGY